MVDTAKMREDPDTAELLNHPAQYLWYALPLSYFLEHLLTKVGWAPTTT